MKPNSTALAVSLLSSVLLLNAQAATAQTTSPPSATATRPATTPPGQTSMPNESPPATTTQTTGEASRDPVVKKMNEDEKQDRSNDIAAEHDRNETGNDTAGANFHSKRKPAGHDHSDHRRSQSRSHGQENERGREAEGRHKGQIV